MKLGYLRCEPISVRCVIAERKLDGLCVAVHGILYLGAGCHEGEYLLLPKDGPFDGVGQIPMPESIDRTECLLIEQPNIDRKLGPSGAVGEYYWKHDCIMVGTIRYQPGTDHPTRIGALSAIILQDWQDMGKGDAYHELRVLIFDGR